MANQLSKPAYLLQFLSKHRKLKGACFQQRKMGAPCGSRLLFMGIDKLRHVVISLFWRGVELVWG